jgi:hypothetical protein
MNHGGKRAGKAWQLGIVAALVLTAASAWALDSESLRRRSPSTSSAFIVVVGTRELDDLRVRCAARQHLIDSDEIVAERSQEGDTAGCDVEVGE